VRIGGLKRKMLDPVYCINYRKAIEQADMFCKHCGADQRHPSWRICPIQEGPSTDMAQLPPPTVRSNENINPELEALKREVEAEAKHRPRLLFLAHRLITTEEDRQFVIGIIKKNA
jgi:hypothetical protein